jgi:hypothetical protein
VIDLVAVTDDHSPPPEPLRLVRCGEVSVLCAPAREGAIDAEALWQREAILEELMEARNVLPVRFGTVVEDERAVADAIEPRAAALATSLARVRGAIEVSVRAVEREPAAEVEGAAHLRARAARERRARELHDRLAAAARAGVVLGGSDLLRGAYLVDRDAVESFVALVRTLQHEHRELSILCTGPWPPYSFTEAAP